MRENTDQKTVSRLLKAHQKKNSHEKKCIYVLVFYFVFLSRIYTYLYMNHLYISLCINLYI